MAKRFTVRNDTFTCFQCGTLNPPAQKTCRNHCTACLYSRHVDAEFPGDRLSSCGHVMKPIGLDYSGKKGFLLLHECAGCGKKTLNKCAFDDEQEALRRVSSGL